MFAKLKKKIAEEEGVQEGELKRSVSQTGSARRESLRRAGESTSSLNSWGSNSSLSGLASLAPKQNDSTAKIESLQAEATKKDELIRKLESKLDEYSALMKEAIRAKEKSELVVEKQQEAATRRIQEINEEFQVRRAKMADKLSTAIKKKEEELQDKMMSLENEKAELQEKLKKTEMQQFMKREESDELQGFQVQELAKVKHMFVNSQEELHKCKADLDHSEEQLAEKARQISSLESELHTSRLGLMDVTKQRDELAKERLAHTDMVRKLGKEKAALDEAMTSVAKENQEKTAKIFILQEKLDHRKDELNLLKHNSEILRNQAKKQIDDKMNDLQQLREKVMTLEQRLQDNSLSQDDHMKAVQSERDGLEQKLGEVRKELASVRSESCAKISSLEKQIEHLNSKIADDTEEFNSSTQKATSTQTQLRGEIADLRMRLESAQKESIIHLQQATQREVQLKAQKEASEAEIAAAHHQITEMKRQSLAVKKQLQDKLAALESQVVTVETARDFDKSASEHKLARLESLNEEYLEKEIEHEKQVSRLEEDLDKLKISVSSVGVKKKHLQTELETSRTRTSELEKRVQEVESLSSRQKEQLSILHASIKEKEQLVKKYETEHSSLQQNCAELNQRIEEQEKTSRASHDEAQKMIFERNETISVLQQSLNDRGEELALITQQLQELQEKLERVEAEAQARLEESELNGHKESENQERLRQSVESLEQQLSDKNKTIKMQQQRLSDLKKTLQRELKVQTIAGYESPEEALRNNDHFPDKSKLAIPDNNFRGSNSSLPSVPATQLDGGMSRPDLREINFQYLRHVVFTFMSSPDYEAKQLLRAVSTVLELTPKEEKIIRETIDWKMSWFGSKPAVKKLVQVSSPGSGLR